MKKVLLFGSNGFIGRSMQDSLQGKFSVQTASSEVLRQKDLAPLKDLISKHMPDFILQFAGVLQFGQEASALYEGNLLPTVHLSDSLKHLNLKHIPVYLLGSAAELGVTTDRPVTEETPCNPHTHYGQSKYFQTQFANLLRQEGFSFSTIRLFNIIGPGMKKAQVPQCFIEQVKASATHIKTGPLDSKRDFLDVRVASDCIVSLLEKNWQGNLIHLCSGVSHTPRELLDQILKISGSPAKVEEEKTPLFGTYPSVSNAKILNDVLGYTPQFQIEKTISDMMECN
jgi:nucleoside-diphosphate-sugar epimerase